MQYDYIILLCTLYFTFESFTGKNRAVARTLIGEGGGVYSFVYVFPDRFLAKFNNVSSI